MVVRLEFVTKDPEEMALATRYWAMDEEGAYLEPVAGLVPFRDIRQPGQIAKQVREYCIAFDENQCCYLCKGPIRINGRADAKKFPQNSAAPCSNCVEERSRKRAEQDALDHAEVSRRIAVLVEKNSSVTFDYDALPDDVVLILLAINAVVEPRLVQGTFSLRDCDDLAPLGSDEFVLRLLHEGYLLQDYYGAKPGAYYLQDGELWRKNYQIEVYLPPDMTHGRGLSSLELLEEHRFSESERLTNLWLDYAVRDVLRYLLDQCAIYNHELDNEAIEKIKITIRNGLRTYSAAQLWSVMWKAVKDAASLASREYYNRQKAAATIPNKIRKLLEAADQEGAISRSWDRPQHHIAGSLGMIFSNLFGVDEYSPGSKVIELFYRLNLSIREQGDDEFRALAEAFMRSALERQEPGAAMNQFAEKIRAGLTTEDAIMEVVNGVV